MLRDGFGPYTKEVEVDWRKLHNEEFMLYNAPPSKCYEDEMGGACGVHTKTRNMFRVFVGVL